MKVILDIIGLFLVVTTGAALLLGAGAFIIGLLIGAQIEFAQQ